MGPWPSLVRHHQLRAGEHPGEGVHRRAGPQGPLPRAGCQWGPRPAREGVGLDPASRWTRSGSASRRRRAIRAVHAQGEREPTTGVDPHCRGHRLRRARGDRPHLLRPHLLAAPAADEAKSAYALLRGAMDDAQRVAIGTVVMRRKQYLAAIRPIEGAPPCRPCASPTKCCPALRSRASQPLGQAPEAGDGPRRPDHRHPGERLGAWSATTTPTPSSCAASSSSAPSTARPRPPKEEAEEEPGSRRPDGSPGSQRPLGP